MTWITQLFVAIWAVTNDYSWFAIDPVASFALVQVNCTIHTLQCLRQAKTVHDQLIKEHVDFYWCTVNEEAARLEHEKQAQAAYDAQVAEDYQKARKYDQNEMSPPVVNVIHNHLHHHLHQTLMNNPTFVAPIFVSTCTTPPEIPGLDVKTLAAKHRPSIDSGAAVTGTAFAKSVAHIWVKQCISVVLLILVCYRFVRFVSAFIWPHSKRFFHSSPPKPTPTPKNTTTAPPLNKSTQQFVAPTTSKLGWPLKSGRYSPAGSLVAILMHKNNADTNRIFSACLQGGRYQPRRRRRKRYLAPACCARGRGALGM